MKPKIEKPKFFFIQYTMTELSYFFLFLVKSLWSKNRKDSSQDFYECE